MEKQNRIYLLVFFLMMIACHIASSFSKQGWYLSTLFGVCNFLMILSSVWLGGCPLDIIAHNGLKGLRRVYKWKFSLFILIYATLIPCALFLFVKCFIPA